MQIHEYCDLNPGTEKRLAKLLGVSTAAISHRKTGRTPWSWDEAILIQEFLNGEVTLVGIMGEEAVKRMESALAAAKRKKAK